jgi:hypothetical protein
MVSACGVTPLETDRENISVCLCKRAGPALRYCQGYHVVWYQAQMVRSLHKRGSAAARLQGLRVRIQPEAWTSASYECCVLPGRGLSATGRSPVQESYRVCVLLSV